MTSDEDEVVARHSGAAGGGSHGGGGRRGRRERGGKLGSGVKGGVAETVHQRTKLTRTHTHTHTYTYTRTLLHTLTRSIRSCGLCCRRTAAAAAYWDSALRPSSGGPVCGMGCGVGVGCKHLPALNQTNQGVWGSVGRWWLVVASV